MTDGPAVAVVTGATSGLGREVASRLATNGWSVAFCGRRKDRVQDLENELLRRGLRVAGFVGDVAEQSFCEMFVVDTTARLGEPNVLVNNAAIIGPTGSALAATATEIFSTLQVNLVGGLSMIRAFVSGGSAALEASDHKAVINIAGGGIGGRSLEWSAFPYVGSKAMLYYLTEILATELREMNITVNCLAPGTLPTEFMLGAAEQALRDGDTRLLSEIEKRKSMDGEVAFDKIVTWIEALVRPEFARVSGRLLSAIWDEPDHVLSVVDSPDLYRLRRIDGEMFGPL